MPLFTLLDAVIAREAVVINVVVGPICEINLHLDHVLVAFSTRELLGFKMEINLVVLAGVLTKHFIKE